MKRFVQMTGLAAVAVVCLSAQRFDYRDLSKPPAYDIRRFQFSLGPASLTSGNMSAAGAVTLGVRPCPEGVAGANTDHYIRISGGVGTAENVLITGGTCTSGAASGTLQFTTANTHTGSWVITSATGGIQEAVKFVQAMATGGAIWIPHGNTTIYAKVTLSGVPALTISGCGLWCSSILVDSSYTSGDVFHVNHAASLIRFHDMTIAHNGTNHSSGAAIRVQNNTAGRPKIQNVRMVNTYGGLFIDNSDYVQVLDSYYDQDTSTTSNYAIKIDGVSSDIQIIGGRYAAPEVNSATMLQNGILISGGDGITISGSMIRAQYGINITPTFGSGSLILGSVFVSGGTIIDRCRYNAIRIVSSGTPTGGDFFGEVFVNSSHISGSPAMETADLVYVNLLSMWDRYAGISFTNNKMTDGNRDGVRFEYVNGYTINGNRILNNDKASVTGAAINLAYTKNGTISGNFLSDAQSVPTQNWGIWFQNSQDQLTVTGNTAYGNTSSAYNNGASFTNSVMWGNGGSDDLIGSFNSAATVTLPSNLAKTFSVGAGGVVTIDTLNGAIGNGDRRRFFFASGISLSTAGNFKTALGPTAANQVVDCTWNSGDSKWYCK